MARRKIIFATNEIYHVYNRGVEKRLIFVRRNDYHRFLELTNYYRFVDHPTKFSHFKTLSKQEKENIFQKLQNSSQKFVDILAFCFMPNHLHFLLSQLVDKGISKFMANVTNAFSHYFNIRHERTGHLFQGNFGAVRIEDDEQLIHVSRYIHLNPVTSYLIELKSLKMYEYSSYPEYFGSKIGFVNSTPILSYFKNKENYIKFVADQADYARELERIKHLVLE